MQKERGKLGRPRSEEARRAVLGAVDDLLLEVGYTAMTMKGIAERAGVGRQTVYRWWSTKAEILFDASADDAGEELAIEPTGTALGDITAYLVALARFLAHSPAGAAYRALLGEAQHDTAVAELFAAKDILGDSARDVIATAIGQGSLAAPEELAASLLIGPTLFWVISGHNPARLRAPELAAAFLREIRVLQGDEEEQLT